MKLEDFPPKLPSRTARAWRWPSARPAPGHFGDVISVRRTTKLVIAYECL